METTKISAERTAQEIVCLLAAAGATAVLTDYSRDRKICGLAFKLDVGGSQMPFSLPARIDPVFQRIQKGRAPRNRTKNEPADRLQAERVAWRQLLRWIQAQLAMIETGMVAAQEVFLPYAQGAGGKTLYEALTASGRLCLPGGPVDAKNRFEVAR
jgi:hypothetical protein